MRVAFPTLAPAFALLLLAGCGQSGDLYLPEDRAAEPVPAASTERGRAPESATPPSTGDEPLEGEDNTDGAAD